MPFLQQVLTPAHAVAAEEIAKQLRDLDSKDFAIRQKATGALESFGEAAEPALTQLLAGKPSPEARKRAERLLQKLDWTGSAERVRLYRALEVLEHIGTREARTLLQDLAAGAPEARLTQEAKASLGRLQGRKYESAQP